MEDILWERRGANKQVRVLKLSGTLIYGQDNGMRGMETNS